VQAGHDGHFGYVVGVNRVDDQHGRELQQHGASTVVTSLDQLR
jgi:beta-phosphoglucomutase-like phosphatase (HAD superfamily)